MAGIQEELNQAWQMLSGISVSGDAVDLLAAARVCLRRAYQLAEGAAARTSVCRVPDEAGGERPYGLQERQAARSSSCVTQMGEMVQREDEGCDKPCASEKGEVL